MFKNRQDAGGQLAKRLAHFKGKENCVVLGIPRGGVAVAFEVAKQIRAPLDVIVIKKLGYPGNEEFAIGAVGLDTYHVNLEYSSSVPKGYIEEQVRIKQQEVQRRLSLFRGKKPPVSLKGKDVIIVDDGIATGETMMLAVKLIQRHSPRSVIVAVPVAPPEAVAALKQQADDVVCLLMPESFMGIGEFYMDFTQVEDDMAATLLREAGRW